MPMRFAPNSIPAAAHQWVVDLQAKCSAHAVVGQAEFIRTQSVAGELQDIKAPALIMSSDGSPFVNRSLAQDLHPRMPASEIQWYPGHRHSLLISAAGRCAAAYADFLQRRCLPASEKSICEPCQSHLARGGSGKSEPPDQGGWVSPTEWPRCSESLPQQPLWRRWEWSPMRWFRVLSLVSRPVGPLSTAPTQ